jgi:hypothetical protein
MNPTFPCISLLHELVTRGPCANSALRHAAASGKKALAQKTVASASFCRESSEQPAAAATVVSVLGETEMQRECGQKKEQVQALQMA